MSVSGIPGGNEIDCPQEAYTMEGTSLTMPNYGTAGDCAHDQFKKADVEFISGTYFAEKDEITLHAKYLFIKVTIVCKKVEAIVAEALAPLTKMLGDIAIEF